MKDLDSMEYSPIAEKVVDILCAKTQNNDRTFFRLLVAYTFAKLAATMRTKIEIHGRGEIPINAYVINLAPSGYGKGLSMNVIEEHLTAGFKQNFLDHTMPILEEESLNKLAVARAARKDTSEEDELVRVRKEYDAAGELAFSFDSATTPAIKQMRHKLLMLGAGAVNMEIDEIGANLSNNLEPLVTLLELFDVGKVKQKLTKNTAENTRSVEIDGKTPTNAMFFGNPAKLLNGAKIQDEFDSLLDQGYARRSFFGCATQGKKLIAGQTIEQIYDALVSNTMEADVVAIADEFTELANYENFGQVLKMTKDTALLLLEYQYACEATAADFPPYKEVRKAEMAHRYFKVAKVAGAYAFVEGSPTVEKRHIYNAIKLAEEDSAKSFEAILSQDKNFVKLAKYLASVGKEVTHVELIEDLPFYKGNERDKRDLMTLATAYGYPRNIVIKRRVLDGIEFMRGESLKETDVNEIRISYSEDDAQDFLADTCKFSDIHELTTYKENGSFMRFSNHWYEDNHRKAANAVQGFNLVVLDIDDGCSIEMARMLLKEYTYHIYTTKSHSASQHRYRILMPISHEVKLDPSEFKEFMSNLFNWFPIKADTAAKDCSRRWMSNNGQYWTNEGQLLDAFLFIPDTRKAIETSDSMVELGNLNAVERWFINDDSEKGRNNRLLKYALMLVDSGYGYDDTLNSVLLLNAKLPEPLEEVEVHTTVARTIAQRISDKARNP